MPHKVKFHARNSSGNQVLHIDIDHPDLEGGVALTLVGEYEGKDIQIDFDPIDKEKFASSLRFLLNQIEGKS